MDEQRDNSRVPSLAIAALCVFSLVLGFVAASIFGEDSDQIPVTTNVVKQEQPWPNVAGQCAALTDIALTGAKVYNGLLSEKAFDGTNGDGTQSGELPKNLGYPAGAKGLQLWLTDVRGVMEVSGKDGDLWSPSENVRIKNHAVDPFQSYTFTSPDGVVGFDYDGNANDDLSGDDRAVIGLILDQVIESQPNNPAEVLAALPAGC